ncbi:MAG: N-acetylmuramic acid 6-phosphate etherase [Terriglobia bacterium]
MPARAAITEQENPTSASLDARSLPEILRIINGEDRKIAAAVRKVLPEIAMAAEWIVEALAGGGRLVYLGAGTSGRLGVLDAVECIPTFGTHQVIGILAGGSKAMFKSVERVEDDTKLAAADLRRINFSQRDVLVAIAASGRTPYTLAGLRYARRLGARAIALTSNPSAPMNRAADLAIVPITGPEVLTGSTRMKAGTAQKLVLNMLSTATMVRLGRVFSNRMINVQTHNAKLRKRAVGILVETTGESVARATKALHQAEGQLPVAMLMLLKGASKNEAQRLLRNGANLAEIVRQARAGSAPRRC